MKRDTVYKWIAEKGMPAHKIGRLWKFKRMKSMAGYAKASWRKQ
ncbi:excisionase family DNA-binding protein [Providencia huaxiensis]